MIEFAWGFLAGFVVASAIAIGWYRGKLKPYVDAKKADMRDKMRGVF